MKLYQITFLGFIFFALLISSCNTPYTYKKRGYFHIDLPQKKYTTFNKQEYPYTFEYPEYAHIIKDTSFFDNSPENPWWINIDIPQLNGRIYLSYKDLSNNNFDTVIAEAYKMAYLKHTDIATGIKDSLMETPNKIEGIYFNLKGNTATANQFFLTDSTKHFIRGALYFDATPNEDSLALVNNFLKKDLLHLINTLRWK